MFDEQIDRDILSLGLLAVVAPVGRAHADGRIAGPIAMAHLERIGLPRVEDHASGELVRVGIQAHASEPVGEAPCITGIVDG
ncbi:hypothetical protein D3C72_1420010 [compost metagenome]